MVISDLMLDRDRSRPLFELTRWAIFVTLAATTLLGRLANSPRVGRWLLPVLALGGSTLFFLTSNLATWGEGLLYPMTLSGLIECYTQAIPFFRNSLAADLMGTAFLFGGNLRRTGSTAISAAPTPNGRDHVGSPRVPTVPAHLTFFPFRTRLLVAKLLVSVRSKAEALAALAGGATIVDVKEPKNGSLGRATFDVWREVQKVVPRPVLVSVAWAS